MSPKKPKRVALYLRVSTSEQSTRNQCRELHVVAERHGWHVVATYEDAGVSGAKGRDKRPGFDRLMVAVARREIDMVAAWPLNLGSNVNLVFLWRYVPVLQGRHGPRSPSLTKPRGGRVRVAERLA